MTTMTLFQLSLFFIFPNKKTPPGKKEAKEVKASPEKKKPAKSKKAE